MPSILPINTSSLDAKTIVSWTPTGGESQSYTTTGTAAEIAATYNLMRAGVWNPLGGRIASAQKEITANGRGSLSLTYETARSVLNDVDDDGQQELIAVDFVRDIKTAPYFESMTPAQKVAVQAQWEERLPEISSWTALQKKLYNHMASGMETWTDTRYELRRSFVTTSQRTLKFSTANPNRVVAKLPRMSATLSKLIDGLPEGEWLKAPTTVTYAGKFGWHVQECYIWAWKWSVIYGGSWTGDAI